MSRPLFAEDLDLVLQQTRGLWNELRGQRVFITGGTGFFGCWLVESFCHANRALGLGAQITVLTRNAAAFSQKCPHIASDPAVRLCVGDVRNFEFPCGEYLYVIHAATEASASRVAEDSLEMFSTIVSGTERTLEFAATHGTKAFLLTSSGAVYGKQPDNMTRVPESYTGGPDPLSPASVYAEGKRASELLCALYQETSGVSCKIARCWAFCGPHIPLGGHFAIGNFIGDVLAGRPIQIKGDGTARRSYLYAADLAIWLWTMLFRAPALMPLNVGSAHDLSIYQLAQVVATTLNPKTEINVVVQAAPGVPSDRYVPSVDRARETLGLREIVGIEDTIRRTARWYGLAI